MAKHPWFKAWAKDILGDKDFATVTLAAKGFWLNLLCLMHLSPRKGYLLQENGTPYSMETLARISGISPDEAAHLYQCLLSSGIFSVSETDPKVPFSRRMVREARITEVRSAAGSKGGSFAQAKFKQTVEQNSSKHPSKPLAYGEIVCSSFPDEKNKDLKSAPVGAGVQGEGEFAQAKIEQTDELSPGSLGVLWNFHRKGRGRESPIEATETFTEMIGMGTPAVAIRDEILAKPPRRDRSEFLWQFKERLVARFKATTKKSPEQERLERLASEREYAKRLREERKARDG